MKKLIAILLALVVISSFVACSKNNDDPSCDPDINVSDSSGTIDSDDITDDAEDTSISDEVQDTEIDTESENESLDESSEAPDAE